MMYTYSKCMSDFKIYGLSGCKIFVKVGDWLLNFIAKYTWCNFCCYEKCRLYQVMMCLKYYAYPPLKVGMRTASECIVYILTKFLADTHG